MSDLISTVAVLEREAVEKIKNTLNAETYKEVKDVLKSEGMSEHDIARVAARITLRIKRAVQDV